MTKEALDMAANANPAVGWVASLGGGVKMKLAATAASGATAIGKVIAIDTVGGEPYYVIRVD